MEQNHHYISQFYLKYFSPDDKPGCVWVYSEKGCELLSIKKHVAFEKNYYAVEGNGESSDIIEKMFSDIEGKVSRVIQKFDHGNLNLTETERHILILYMSYLRTRIPAFRDSINWSVVNERRLLVRMLASNEDFFQREMVDIINELDEKDKFNYSEFKDYIKNNLNRMDLRMDQNKAMEVMLIATEDLYRMLNKMNWNFLKSSGNCFYITSDRPVFPFMNNWKQPYLPGFAFEDVEVYFPVTPRLCMMGTYKDLKTVYSANDDMVNVINSRVISNSYKYLYSCFDMNRLEQQVKPTINKFKV